MLGVRLWCCVSVGDGVGRGGVMVVVVVALVVPWWWWW